MLGLSLHSLLLHPHRVVQFFLFNELLVLFVAFYVLLLLELASPLLFFGFSFPLCVGFFDIGVVLVPLFLEGAGLLELALSLELFNLRILLLSLLLETLLRILLVDFSLLDARIDFSLSFGNGLRLSSFYSRHPLLQRILLRWLG